MTQDSERTTLPLKSFDRVAHVYDETRGLPAEVEERIAEAIAHLAREVAPEPRILEVGIGTGRIAAPLAMRGLQIAGFDISPKMLARLREKRRDIDVVLAEGSRPPFRAASFDVALFVHILHLVPEPELTVRSAARVLRPGGMLISGGDDYSPRGYADGIIERAAKDMAGVDLAGWDNHERAAEAFERAADTAGAALERQQVARWTSRTTPRRILDRLERRDYSSSWRIPDAALPNIVSRVASDLEREYGSLDADFEFERGFSIAVARLP